MATRGKAGSKGAEGTVPGARGDPPSAGDSPEALRASEEPWRQLFENAPVGYHEIDRRGRIVRVNQTEAELLGRRAEEMIGREIFEFMADPQIGRAAVEKKFFGRVSPDPFERRYVRKDGTLVDLLIVDRPILDREGRVVGLRSILQDITSRKEMEREIRRAKEAADAANAAKTQFLATMSHELRTPLNSVIGFARVLMKNKGGRLSAQEIAYLERIDENGRHLLNLISDLLDLSRLELGREDLSLAPVDLVPLVAGIVAQMEPQLRGPSVTLRAECPPAAAPIVTDRRKVKQILMNLVGNALKFTEEGSVVVRLAAARPGKKGGPARPLRIEVEDTGPGIAEGRLARIFDPFPPPGPERTHPQAGPGMGLAISKSLADLLGFSLEARSVPGKGALFILRLAPANPERLSGGKTPAGLGPSPSRAG